MVTLKKARIITDPDSQDRSNNIDYPVIYLPPGIFVMIQVKSQQVRNVAMAVVKTVSGVENESSGLIHPNMNTITNMCIR